MKKLSPKIVLLVALLSSTAIAYWGIAYNQATVIINSELDNYQVEIGNITNTCIAQACEYKVKPKNYLVTINASSYTDQKEEIALERGDKIEITYEPLKLPEIEESNTRLEEYIPAQLRTGSSGEQLLWVNQGEDLGEKQVTRFANALTSPTIEVSPSRNFVLVKSLDQIWLVDVQKETKKTYEFALDEQPTRFRFISDDLVVVENQTNYEIYNLKEGTSSRFPITNIRHVIATSTGDIAVLSYEDLSTVRTNKTKDLLSLISETGEDIINRQATEDLSLYLYSSSRNEYIQIEELRVTKYGANPTLKKSKNNIYLETNKGQFILNI